MKELPSGGSFISGQSAAHFGPVDRRRAFGARAFGRASGWVSSVRCVPAVRLRCTLQALAVDRPRRSGVSLGARVLSLPLVRDACRRRLGPDGFCARARAQRADLSVHPDLRRGRLAGPARSSPAPALSGRIRPGGRCAGAACSRAEGVHEQSREAWPDAVAQPRLRRFTARRRTRAPARVPEGGSRPLAGRCVGSVSHVAPGHRRRPRTRDPSNEGTESRLRVRRRLP